MALPRLASETSTVWVTHSESMAQGARVHGLRRDAVHAGLLCLIQHHPGYKDFVISQERLALIPENGNFADAARNEEAYRARKGLPSCPSVLVREEKGDEGAEGVAGEGAVVPRVRRGSPALA